MNKNDILIVIASVITTFILLFLMIFLQNLIVHIFNLNEEIAFLISLGTFVIPFVLWLLMIVIESIKET